jgi:hypothetical protein
VDDDRFQQRPRGAPNAVHHAAIEEGGGNLCQRGADLMAEDDVGRRVQKPGRMR